MDGNTIRNYELVEKAIKYIISDFRRQPSLDEIAARTGLSPHHFQRVFTEWAGVSPKKFLEYITVENLKKEIIRFPNISEAAESVGLSAQSRVYDLFINIESVTPGEYRSAGKGVEIEYGFAATPFGECFVAATARGVCALKFTDGDRESALGEFRDEWANASLARNDRTAADVTEKIFGHGRTDGKLTLALRGTPFQLKVWKALLEIPAGEVVTYGRLAEKAGNAKAVRAVASAVAANPVGYIIPCHRVIRSEGLVGEYHWRPERKAAMIGWEKSKVTTGGEVMPGKKDRPNGSGDENEG